MIKYEYQIFNKNINIDNNTGENIIKYLNELGDKGWEVIRDTTKGATEKPMIVLSVLCKRVKSKIITV